MPRAFGTSLSKRNEGVKQNIVAKRRVEMRLNLRGKSNSGRLLFRFENNYVFCLLTKTDALFSRSNKVIFGPCTCTGPEIGSERWRLRRCHFSFSYPALFFPLFCTIIIYLILLARWSGGISLTYVFS